MAPTRPAGDSQERLLDAADRLMYARGYQDVGVADLCREAGVRPGSFYYYFASKEALAATMLERAWTRTDATIFTPALNDTSLDPFEAIDRYAELLQQNLERLAASSGVVVGCRFGNFAVEAAPHLAQVGESTLSIFDAMAARFRAVIERGQHQGHIDPDASPDILARMLLAQMQGLMVLAKVTADPTAIRLLGPAARRLLAPAGAGS